MSKSTALLSSPLGSLEGKSMRRLPRYLQPLWEQQGPTAEEYAAQQKPMYRSNDTAVAELDAIAFCEACGEETPVAAHALDQCPHCGF